MDSLKPPQTASVSATLLQPEIKKLSSKMDEVLQSLDTAHSKRDGADDEIQRTVIDAQKSLKSEMAKWDKVLQAQSRSMESNSKMMERLDERIQAMQRGVRDCMFAGGGGGVGVDGVYDHRLDQAMKLYIGTVDENNLKRMNALWEQLSVNVNDSRQETYRYWNSEWTSFKDEVGLADLRETMHRILVTVLDLRPDSNDEHNEDEEKEAAHRTVHSMMSDGTAEMTPSIDLVAIQQSIEELKVAMEGVGREKYTKN